MGLCLDRLSNLFFPVETPRVLLFLLIVCDCSYKNLSKGPSLLLELELVPHVFLYLIISF